MKKLALLIIAIVLFIGCEKDPVTVNPIIPEPVVPDFDTITYCVSNGDYLGVNEFTLYTILYTDPQYRDTLQEVTFWGEWEHQMLFEGDSFKFEIYHYSYVKANGSCCSVPEYLYSFPDGCYPYIFFNVYVNGVCILDCHQGSLREEVLSKFYNPNGPDWNHLLSFGYAYNKNDPYNPEIYENRRAY